MGHPLKMDSPLKPVFKIQPEAEKFTASIFRRPDRQEYPAALYITGGIPPIAGLGLSLLYCPLLKPGHPQSSGTVTVPATQDILFGSSVYARTALQLFSMISRAISAFNRSPAYIFFSRAFSFSSSLSRFIHAALTGTPAVAQHTADTMFPADVGYGDTALCLL
jgi:hypothetical protein